MSLVMMGQFLLIVFAGSIPASISGHNSDTYPYLHCIPGRFGRHCEWSCNCRFFEDCVDGPRGDGSCLCPMGLESLCTRWEVNLAAINLSEFRPLLPSIPPPNTDFDENIIWRGRQLSNLIWDHRALRELITDPLTSTRSRIVVNASISRVLPTPYRSPGNSMLLAVDARVAHTVGWDVSSLPPDAHSFFIPSSLPLWTVDIFGSPSDTSTPQSLVDPTQWLSGGALFPGSFPHAHLYDGHQFGVYAGQLGDGRALSLGHVRARLPNNSSSAMLEIALKGAGRTPYSRGGDGRATLQAALREMLGSAALRGLRVPATRALAVATNSDPANRVLRDPAHRNSPDSLVLFPPAVLTRVAPSFLRVGSVEGAARVGGLQAVRRLVALALRTMGELDGADLCLACQ
jgi:hypothetical protein